jgi:hypothetical protein
MICDKQLDQRREERRLLDAQILFVREQLRLRDCALSAQLLDVLDRCENALRAGDALFTPHFYEHMDTAA